MIKKILLALCILVSFLQIKAQNIKGVNTLPRIPNYKRPTFLFKDKTDNIWIGFGGINYNFNSFGLFRLNKQTNKWDIINKKQSTITNYFETDSSILFTSFEGLQTYKGSKLILNDSIVNILSTIALKDGITSPAAYKTKTETKYKLIVQ